MSRIPSYRQVNQIDRFNFLTHFKFNGMTSEGDKPEPP